MEFKGTKGSWRIGNHFSNIVTDEKPNRPTYSEKDWQSEKTYYGGYIVAESISKKEDANIISASKELLEFALSVENDNNSIPKAIWDLRNKAIKKALGK